VRVGNTLLDATLTHKRAQKRQVGWAAALERTVQVLDCGDSLACAKRYKLMGATIWAAPARLNSYAQGMDEPESLCSFADRSFAAGTPRSNARIGERVKAPLLWPAQMCPTSRGRSSCQWWDLEAEG